ncbi:ribonuclease T2 family protein [Legionella sp. CNM-1927-20]|uniref:ribonuclease T2 family protein n=1 Tax=Legionella sp. CNM-1927-20 TaxID=3422221 RepID=UPI00403A809F
MKYRVGLFLFLFSLTTLALPVVGEFEAAKICPAYLSKNKKTNPDGLFVQPNTHYQINEINRANNPDWFRIEIPENSQYPLRWVNSDCGYASFEINQANCQQVPGMADSYVLALSWQPGFCQTYGYEAGKPECLRLPSNSYQASHLVLHGLWPNQDVCGQAYGFCNTRPQSNHCDYPALDFSEKVANLLRLLMPSFAVGSCLERHEWYKHGTCQILSNDDYFSLALRLTQEAQATVLGNFLHSHVGQRVPLTQLKEVIGQSFGIEAVNKIYLGCKNGYLVDIFIQLPALIPFNEPLNSLVLKAKGFNRYDGCPTMVSISNFSKKTFQPFDLRKFIARFKH